MQFDRGFVSPFLINDFEKQSILLEDADVIVTDMKINDLKDLVPMLEPRVAAGHRKFFIIADDFDEAAIRNFVHNKMSGIMEVAIVKAPSFEQNKKDILKDIAILTGAKLISGDILANFPPTDPSYLGRVGKVIVTKDTTTIVDGKGDSIAIEARKKEISDIIANPDTNEVWASLAKTRLAKFTGGVAVISVGAPTDMEAENKIYKIEDAINATSAAVDGGIVWGGGLALFKIGVAFNEMNTHKDESLETAYAIIGQAIQIPFNQILMNAGHDDDSITDIIETISRSDGANYGYNAKTSQYGDMLEMGIIDPVKVVKAAVKNAISAAGVFITCQAAIIPASKDLPSHQE